MEFECIIYQKEADIAIIRLNRPKVLNAMNRQLWIDFQSALEDAGLDPAVNVVLITGEGRAFSSGADLKESKTRSAVEYREYLVGSRRRHVNSSALKNRPLRPSTDMPLGPAMNWHWPAISASLMRRPRSVLPKPGSHHR